ncbi:MAG: ligand-binding sensor domain-containing protein [bacterium]
MHSRFLFFNLVLTILIVGCGISNKNFNDGTKMIVIDGGASLYNGNELIASLPAGTEVTMLENKGKWCLVEVNVNEYNMKVKGLMKPDSLSPMPETAITKVVAPEVSPYYESKQKEIWSEFFPNIGINCIALDGDNIWLGTTSGLVKFPASAPSRAVTYTMADGLLDNDVLSVDVYEGEVWIGTSKGLNKFYNSNFLKYTKEDGLLEGSIMAIDASEDYVWLGLDTGLARIDRTLGFIQNWPHSGGWSPESGSGSVSLADKGGIYADSIMVEDDCVWNAAFNLTKTSINGRDLLSYGCGEGLIHSRVVDFYVDENNIWVTTLGGITRIDRKDDKIYEQFDIRGGYMVNPVISACHDGKYIWIVTKDGLSKFDTQKKKFITYFACWDTFKGGYVSDIKSDEKNLWLATSQGLWRMDKSAADAMSDRDLLDDFESKTRLSYRGWQLGRRGGKNGSENIFVDYTVGANKTSASLCNSYIAPDQKAHYIGHIAVSVADMDLTDYDGISFFVKAEPAVDLSASVYENNETWVIGSWHVPRDWMEIRVPFSQFKPHGQESGNNILELYALQNIHFGIKRNYAFGPRPKPNEGESGKFWIDEIRFYKSESESFATK